MQVPEHLLPHARHSSQDPVCLGQPGDVVSFMMNLQTHLSERSQCDTYRSLPRSTLWLCQKVHRHKGIWALVLPLPISAVATRWWPLGAPGQA